MGGVIYHVPTNENNGADTLHGGPNGWDYVSRKQKHLYAIY
jgi:galactose mutarotase-like enzyme